MIWFESISFIGLRYRHLIETVQPPNLWQPTDSFISGIQRPYPAQQITNDSIDLNAPIQFQSTNSYYPSHRTQISPSGTAFPQLFTYVPPSFNHHLSSTVDDNSLLIQNPSVTWLSKYIHTHAYAQILFNLYVCFF